jgi:hypothetical protein
MARAFSTEQRTLLKASAIRARVCLTFFLDEGTYRFCDDIIDANFEGDTYIGANPLAESIEIKSGRDLSAEPITLTLDGNKMTQAGIDDPAKVLSEILGYLHHQRRVDITLGLSYPNSPDMQMMLPMAAMKINHCRLVDEQINPFEVDKEVTGKLIIVMDSLASRYSRATYRTRSHADQLEIDPTDMFFSFVGNTLNQERTLYWGRRAPLGGAFSGGYSGVSSVQGGAGGSILDSVLSRDTGSTL